MVRSAKNNLTTTEDCFYYHFRAYVRKLNMLKIKDLEVEIVLGIHDLFGTELAMIFFSSCWTNCFSNARDAFFFLSVSVRHFLATALPDLLF
jgi:hypothetical protein